MSELFAARQGRSAWELALPLGQKHLLKTSPFGLSLETRLLLLQSCPAFLSDSCQPLGSAAQLWVFDTGKKH